MLQLRRDPLARIVRSLNSVALTVTDRFVASDPGLVRLTLAARGTLSVFLTALAAMAAGHLAQLSPVEFASGVTLSMMGPFMMREPTLRQRRRTLVLLALSAAGATVLTALLHGHGPAGDSFFLVLVFLCFLFHPRSPRMTGIGLVAVVTTYVGLYLELPPATLPLQLASIAVAVPVIAFACFVAVPMNPAATLRRTVRSVQWRAAEVLRSARRIADGDTLGAAPGEIPARRLRRDLRRLNEAALAADDLLALLHPTGRDALRAGLINLELATARLIDALREERSGPRQTKRLRLHELRMRRGRPYAMTPGLLEPGTLLTALVELGHAVHRLGTVAGTMVPAGDVEPEPGLPPGPPAWRLATQATLAAALAMAGGMALSPNRWFWAVITVYVVFLNARSRGDTIYKGLQRLGGTLLGIASGLLLAMVLVGDETLQVVALLLSIFGMFYFFLVSYVVGIFCVTVMLGLLYGMLGAPLETLLVLRLEETAIGAAAGILVAAFVFPSRTRDQVIRSGRNVLSTLAEAVRSSRETLARREGLAGVPGGSPMQVMRRVDRQVADLRLALAPLSAGRVFVRRSGLERPLPALLECVHWARVLAAAAHEVPAGPAPEALVRRAAAIEIRLTDLAQARPVVPQPPVPAAEKTWHAPTDRGDQGRAAVAMDNLELAVARLAKRIEIGGLQGFSRGG